jgi:hypothetical protein
MADSKVDTPKEKVCPIVPEEEIKIITPSLYTCGECKKEHRINRVKKVCEDGYICKSCLKDTSAPLFTVDKYLCEACSAPISYEYYIKCGFCNACIDKMPSEISYFEPDHIDEDAVEIKEEKKGKEKEEEEEEEDDDEADFVCYDCKETFDFSERAENNDELCVSCDRHRELGYPEKDDFECQCCAEWFRLEDKGNQEKDICNGCLEDWKKAEEKKEEKAKFIPKPAKEFDFGDLSEGF